MYLTKNKCYGSSVTIRHLLSKAITQRLGIDLFGLKLFQFFIGRNSNQLNKRMQHAGRSILYNLSLRAGVYNSVPLQCFSNPYKKNQKSEH